MKIKIFSLLAAILVSGCLHATETTRTHITVVDYVTKKPIPDVTIDMLEADYTCAPDLAGPVCIASNKTDQIKKTDANGEVWFTTGKGGELQPFRAKGYWGTYPLGASARLQAKGIYGELLVHQNYRENPADTDTTYFLVPESLMMSAD